MGLACALALASARSRQLAQGLHLGQRPGQVQLREAHLGRHVGEQVFDARQRRGGQHLGPVGGGVGTVGHLGLVSIHEVEAFISTPLLPSVLSQYFS